MHSVISFSKETHRFKGLHTDKGSNIQSMLSYSDSEPEDIIDITDLKLRDNMSITEHEEEDRGNETDEAQGIIDFEDEEEETEKKKLLAKFEDNKNKRS